MDRKQIGSINELLVFAELMKYGSVSKPIVDNSRYDCIFDYKGRLYRIQVKTACQTKEDCFYVPFCNRRQTPQGVVRKPYTSEQVDFIACYYKGRVLLIKVDDSIVGAMFFRETYPKNGIKKTVNLYADYLLEKVLNML